MPATTVVEVSPGEIDRLWQTLDKAFPAIAPLVNIMFPGRGSPAGDASIAARLKAKASKSAKSHSHFIEAMIDGESVGAAIWTEFFEEPSSDLAELEDVERVWPEESDRAFAALVWEQYMVHRGAFVREHAKDGTPVWGRLRDGLFSSPRLRHST
jgi:hypothetical protein